jgi:hippurate hydrolase
MSDRDLLFTAIEPLLDDLRSLYEDLHAHPELSFEEHRTAAIAAERLRALGCEVTTGVGGTGVVGVLANGPGPRVLLRADMDALPVTEATGLPYASTVRATDADGHDVGVAHACGHDMHVTWLVGAAQVLAEHRDRWSGTLLLVVQPAEELGAGARAMIDDGFLERFGTPDVCLGQHLAPAPAGWVLTRSGPAMAGSDALKVTLHGRGGHGSMPELTVDPAVLAASTIMKLQTITSRERAAHEPVVVTVGSVRVGTKENIISDRAELGLSIRTFNEAARAKVLAAVERICHGEAHSCGAPDPEIETRYTFPPLVNDPAATERVSAAFVDAFGPDRAMEGPQALGSEDFSFFGTSAGCPSVFWFTGGHDPEAWMAAFAAGRLAEDVPFNHSPLFAPVQDPTIRHGIECLLTATLAWAGVEVAQDAAKAQEAG